MNIAQIEENLQKLIKTFKKETFIFDLLLAYGQPKASIKRLQGGLNLSKVEGEILWKKKLFFIEAPKQDIHKLFNEVKADPKAKKHAPRFIVITDFKNLVDYDTKTTESLDILILEIPKHFDFFLPLAGMEKHNTKMKTLLMLKQRKKWRSCMMKLKRTILQQHKPKYTI